MKISTLSISLSFSPLDKIFQCRIFFFQQMSGLYTILRFWMIILLLLMLLIKKRPFVVYENLFSLSLSFSPLDKIFQCRIFFFQEVMSGLYTFLRFWMILLPSLLNSRQLTFKFFDKKTTTFCCVLIHINLVSHTRIIIIIIVVNHQTPDCCHRFYVQYHLRSVSTENLKKADTGIKKYSSIQMKRLNDMDDDDEKENVTKQTKLEFSKEALMYGTVAGDRKKVMKLLDVRDGRTFLTLKLTSLFHKVDIHITYIHT